MAVGHEAVDHEAVDYAKARLRRLRGGFRWAVRFRWYALAAFMVFRVIGLIQTGWAGTLFVMGAIALSPFVFAGTYGFLAGTLMRRFKRQRRL